MNIEQFEAVISRIHYRGWFFKIGQDGDRAFLQIRVNGCCNVDGKPMDWSSRKWFLSPHMTPSEVVQTAFKAVLTAEEHEARERFLYLGRSIFDPHYDVDQLWRLRGEPSAIQEREKPTTQP